MAQGELEMAKGRYVMRLAGDGEDLERAHALRRLAFCGAVPADEFDPICHHVLIEERSGGRLVCTFRLLPLSGGGQIGSSYAARFYDLGALAGFEGPMLEMGRFCIHPGARDPDILRLAWGALTSYVDAQGIEMLFGCTSFRGTDAARYAQSFAMLRQRHQAPRRWQPGIKAPDVVRFAAPSQPQPRHDALRGLRQMPPLLRSYLLMGGWVSDHAVVDRQMNTLHVFTGLETGAIPPMRKRLLRRIAA